MSDARGDQSVSGKSGQQQIELGGAGSLAEQRPGDRALEAVAALARSSSFGVDHFCDECVVLLASTFGVDYAYVSVFTDDSRSRLRTVAFCAGGELVGNRTYEVAGAPCADVLTHDRVFIPDAAMDVYPDARLLAELRADGYYGAALTASSGEKLGVVVVAHTGPITKDITIHPVLSLFADRISLNSIASAPKRSCNSAPVCFGTAPRAS